MMLCNQCAQTPKGGCVSKVGVCGKSEDVASLQDILLYGLKGIGAYGFHARQLGGVDTEIDGFLHEALFSTITNVNFEPGRFVNLVLKAGEMNIKVMELLDRVHTEHFGDPVPTPVWTGAQAGPGILVTGHDLLDLSELLKQIRENHEEKVNVYTHCEMLPAHAYPELNKYKNLVANYGGIWYNQRREFDAFPGAILATTNCVLTPKDSYKDRLFTCGPTGLEGVQHIANRNFGPIIEKAKSLPELQPAEGQTITVGFHHKAVLGLAEKIVGAVKSGKIRHFFLVGGCDTPGSAGNYYRKFVQSVPDDCVILTLACLKYRFNDLDLGEIDGIPRLLDVGQCNNAYSAIQIAAALAQAFKTDVNGLPLSFILSWFEQKAVAILLSLLHLGIKDMRIGPVPPAFISEGVFKILQDTFNLKLITTPEQDLKEILG